MKLRKPDIPSSPPPCEDFEAVLAAARREDTDIADITVRGFHREGFDLSKLNFRRVVFENCRLTGCRMARCDFTDVVFRGCDLSNSDFTSATLYRSAFHSVKALGLSGGEAVLRHLLVEGGSFRYARFDSAAFSTVHIVESDWQEALLTQCRLEDLTLRAARLTGANFFHTPLKGVDFTSCDIEGIGVSQEAAELRGAVVSPFQAADLARLLGVIIR